MRQSPGELRAQTGATLKAEACPRPHASTRATEVRDGASDVSCILRRRTAAVSSAALRAGLERFRVFGREDRPRKNTAAHCNT